MFQLVKTAVATMLAWWIATTWLHSALPFLAPWTALVTVQPTVYRTVANSARTVVSTLLGVGVAAGATALWGANPVGLTAAVSVGLALSLLRRSAIEGATVATTALFVIATSDPDNPILLTERVVEVVVGAVVGIVVNATLVPPLRHRQASESIDGMYREVGRILTDLARDLGGAWDRERAGEWVHVTEGMDERLRLAYAQVDLTAESARWNPRTSRRRAELPDAARLDRMRDGVAHLRHLVRTLESATRRDVRWDAQFRRDWTGLVEECGRRLAEGDGNGLDAVDLVTRIDDLVASMSHRHLPDLQWPLYGSLLESLLRLIEAVDAAETSFETEADGQDCRAGAIRRPAASALMPGSRHDRGRRKTGTSALDSSGR